MTSFPTVRVALLFVQKYSCLYNKKKITQWLEDMNFIFSWKETIFYSLSALVRKILFLPLENKIHIFAPPCNTLYVLNTNNSKLKGRFDNHVETDLEPNFCEIILTCAVILNGLNPHSIDSTNNEIKHTLKLAWVIHATLFAPTSNSVKFQQMGLTEV